MNTFKSIIIGLVLIALAIVVELEWIRTGDTAMGIYTLLAALAAAAFIGHALRLICDSAYNVRYPIKAAA